jgi:arylsulfatase A-like enzyme
MQGASLVPLLKGEKPTDWRKSIYYHYYEYPSVHMIPRHYGIRNQRYKLMHFYQFDEWEFYDLKEDPDELVNLYNDPEYARRIQRAKKDLKALQKDYEDDSDISVMPKEWQYKVRDRG